ncbi:MAG TPA: redoxin domain-containing protein [Nitrososphaerales archaeon]|nr:redoxin domain-containing protein [Nitrososphaerales archaeon]
MVLRVGQRVPDFTLTDHTKQERKLSDYVQKGNVVIAFFPFAFSGVCDREMCTFRDSVAKLDAVKASVLGVSVDSLFALNVFAQTYGIEYPLLSDFNKKVSRAFDVLQDPWVSFGYRGVAKRSVFVLDRKGILRYRWVTDVPGEEPPYDEVMASLAKLGQ